MQWFSVRTHNTGVVSSNPTRVTVKKRHWRGRQWENISRNPLSKKKLQALILVSATLEIEYAAAILDIKTVKAAFLTVLANIGVFISAFLAIWGTELFSSELCWEKDHGGL